MHCQSEEAEILISKGADIHAKDKFGWTPLHFAAYRNCKESAALLLSKNVDIHAKTTNYFGTALHIAVRNRYPEIIELLLAHGADVNEKDRSGETALHIAIVNEGCGKKSVIEILLAGNANIYALDKKGRTVMQRAADSGCLEAIELLEQHAARIAEHEKKTS